MSHHAQTDDATYQPPAGWGQLGAVPARLLDLLIAAYQRVLSPLIGSRCRFEPSCSTYAREALAVHGAVRGIGLTVWRLLRCQPFGTPGYDPVPAPRGVDDGRRPRADSGSAPADLPCHRETHRVTRGARAC